jgi:hypothetical protein
MADVYSLIKQRGESCCSHVLQCGIYVSWSGMSAQHFVLFDRFGEVAVYIPVLGNGGMMVRFQSSLRMIYIPHGSNNLSSKASCVDQIIVGTQSCNSR